MTTLLWILIAIQIAMAAFDTIYHHELTERLAWRPSQRHELALHAARSFVYAALFVVLGFLELHGVFAMLVIAALARRGVHHARGLHRGGHEPQAAGERAREPHAARDQLWRDPRACVLPLLVARALDPDLDQARLARILERPDGVRRHRRGDLRPARPACVAPPRCGRHAARRSRERMPPRQTVLVTGATGFIGRRWCRRSPSRGIR